MVAYTLRRILAALVMLIVMSIVTFLLFYVSPTDPARLTCGKNCTPELIAANRHNLGFDKPIYTQYFDFVKGLVHERKFPDDPKLEASAPQLITHCAAPCLGYSFLQHAQVKDMIKARLPVSVSVAIYAFIIWIIVGVTGGVIAALFRGRWPDRLLVGVALIGYSFPTFFIGLTLYVYVALQHQLLPIPGYVPFTSDPMGFLRGALLPAITLASIYAAGYIRLTRAYVLEAMGEDYLRTARSKGLGEFRVITKHTLRAALTPITTIAGLDLGGLLAGAAITETVFGFEGLGRLAVNSAVTSDLPVNVAIVLIAASFIIFANLAVDLLYAYIDPRVRYA